MLGLLGLRSQNMDGRTGSRVAQAFFTAFSPGNTSWTCPATGYYTFTGRGPGASDGGLVGGGSGAATQKTVLLFTGQVVNFVIGQALRFSGVGAATDTVITLPSGLVVTAGRGIGAVGGTASGGDLNVSGLTTSTGIGAASPTIGDFAGSPGMGVSSDLGGGVGVGGSTNGSTTRSDPGPGILYVQYGKPV